MKLAWLLALGLPAMLMADDDQKIHDIAEEDEARLMEQRQVVEKYLTEDSKEKYKTAAGKLGLLRALIDKDVFKKDQTYELQCMGIVLGDVFVQEMKMEWIVVEDSYGRDPAVRMPGTSVIIFPLTMISKRIEREEEVDVFELFNGVANFVDEKVAEERKRAEQAGGRQPPTRPESK